MMVDLSWGWQSQRRLLGTGRRCLFSLLVLLLSFLPSTASHAYPAARVQTTPVAANPASLFVVNSAADPGDGVCTADECTLREVIVEAKAQAGSETITFAIPGAGPHTIRLASPLPELTGGMTIDGYSQPGAQPNTNSTDQGLNTRLMIEIDGSLTLRSATTIKGIAVSDTISISQNKSTR